VIRDRLHGSTWLGLAWLGPIQSVQFCIGIGIWTSRAEMELYDARYEYLPSSYEYTELGTRGSTICVWQSSIAI
jgi:hypothetical protein